MVLGFLVGCIWDPLFNFAKQYLFSCISNQWELRRGVEEMKKDVEKNQKKIEQVVRTVTDEVEVERKEGLIKTLLMDLKEALYAAEDVLDELDYHRLQLDELDYLRLQQDMINGSPGQHQVSCLPITSCFSFLSPGEFVRRIRLPTELLENLKKAQNELENLLKREEVSELPRTSGATPEVLVPGHDETSSFVDEYVHLVREQERMVVKICRKLLSSCGGPIPVLPVVGHGGMGKTTLAQHVFNSEDFQDHKKIWLSVSGKLHVRDLTMKMIQYLAPEGKNSCSDEDNLEMMQLKLKNSLLGSGSMFLIVLDDVWYDENRGETEKKWEQLRKPLATAATASGGRSGGKVLLTSREVDDLPGALEAIRLEGLPADQCWAVIQRQVIAGRSIGIPDSLVDIGKQIATRVSGSPLAAKAIGGILRNKLDVQHWNHILKTDELLNLTGTNIMPVLMLSYQHLSFELRQCFAYCSLFPKGYDFDDDVLVQMWVAQGFIPGGVTLQIGKKTSRDYFQELLSKAFFIEKPRRKPRGMTARVLRMVWMPSFYVEKQGRKPRKYYIMHDLMHDLARLVSRDEYFTMIDSLPDHNATTIPTIRHVAVSLEHLDAVSRTRCISLGSLRSLIIFDWTVNFDFEGFKAMLRQLRCLRVLDLSELLDPRRLNLSELRDLRRLNLSELLDLSELRDLRRLNLSDSAFTFFKKDFGNHVHFQPRLHIALKILEARQLNLKKMHEDVARAATKLPPRHRQLGCTH